MGASSGTGPGGRQFGRHEPDQPFSDDSGFSWIQAMGRSLDPKASSFCDRRQGWGGEEARLNLSGQGYYYVLATIVVDGETVTTDAPVFASQPADPLWEATPDVTRTFSLEQLPQVGAGSSTSTISISTARSLAKASCRSSRSVRSRNGPSSMPAR